MAIETFAQRQKADYIYKTYFDPYSEHVIDFGLLDTLDFYGALDKGDFDKLTEKFEKIGDNLLAEMKAFDKKQLK